MDVNLAREAGRAIPRFHCKSAKMARIASGCMALFHFHLGSRALFGRGGQEFFKMRSKSFHFADPRAIAASSLDASGLSPFQSSSRLGMIPAMHRVGEASSETNKARHDASGSA
jgi:hypothetical protein